MQSEITFKDLGVIEYKRAWDCQERIFNETLEIKKNNSNLPLSNQKPTQNHFLFCEHPHVYTLGKSGSKHNLLINNDFLKQIEASYYKTNRGGDITYHGFGQVVGYPILDLESLNLSLKNYIYKLEEAIINSLKEFNIFAQRLENATGVWIVNSKDVKLNKICAIGVKSSRWVTMHGFALNVNTDLTYFNYINPCGFTDKGVTSMEKELGRTIDINEVKAIITKNIIQAFISTSEN